MERAQRALAALDRALSNDAAGAGVASKATSTESQSLYSPWSQTQYVRRARSFHWSWAARRPPADVSTCARYGWECSDRGNDHDDHQINSSIQCVTCKARLFLPWDEDALVRDAQKILAEEYFEKISRSGHARGTICPWTVAACHADIAQARLVDVPAERERVRTACLSMGGLRGARIVLGRDADQWRGSFAAAREWLNAADLDDGIVALAVLQWQVREGTEVLECRFGCHEVHSSAVCDEFDPLAGHAWYCPLLFGDRPASQTIPSLWTEIPAPCTGGSLVPALSRHTCEQIERVLVSRKK